jgi:hypothetical protein
MVACPAVRMFSIHMHNSLQDCIGLTLHPTKRAPADAAVLPLAHSGVRPVLPPLLSWSTVVVSCLSPRLQPGCRAHTQALMPC